MRKEIEEMNVAVLDTEASGRPAGQLWDAWSRLRKKAEELDLVVRWVLLDATCYPDGASGAAVRWIARLKEVVQAKAGGKARTMPEGKIEMVPCPFCEGPPVPIATNAIAGGVVRDEDLPAEDGLSVEAYVFCHECGAQGPMVDGLALDKEDCDRMTREAAEAWNLRNARHRDLFDAGERDGLNVYPRTSVN